MSLATTIKTGSAHAFADGPRLLADIGGTNARFALEIAPGQIDAIQVLRCIDHAEFVDATVAYLAACGNPPVRHAAIAIANPVHGDEIRMTNHHWTFSIEAARRRLGFDTLLVANDFTALAMALPHLADEDCRQIGSGQACADSAIGLVGAGTGLGVGGLIPAGNRWAVLSSEGGHVSFAPNDARELDVLQYAWRKYPHVSAERLVSGSGIELTHEALAARRGGQTVLNLTAPDIVTRALDGSDALCMETVECFCAMLGTVAANVALTLGALGGIYIGGGIVPRLGEYFARSPFRARFENKGRFTDYLVQVPTAVIVAPYPAFVGIAAMLAERLSAGGTLPGTDLNSIPRSPAA